MRSQKNTNLPQINHVCFYLASFGDGGVERMITNIALGMSQAGVRVDFIVNKNGAPFIDILEGKVNFIEPDKKAGNAVNWLADYFKAEQPQISMTIKDLDDFTAINARDQSGVKTKVIVRTGTALKTRFQQRGANFLKVWIKSRKLKAMYQKADGHIVVAQGTKNELIELVDLEKDRVILIKNPVITKLMMEQKEHIINHDWFADTSKPLILGIGGFRKQKDFSTLIKAFALVNQSRPCQLVILGQGRQEARLKKLCLELGIAEHVDFPGFSNNPYAWLKRADLFVLSSLWEGSPNVLTEALAIGTPVVSTDCQSGPREVLQDGKYGELVPLQDPEAMAAAMMRTLDKPIASETLQQAVKDYTVEASTQAYLDAFRYFLSTKREN
jgi:glycosyltransferase involved in cell wall biosynthesis